MIQSELFAYFVRAPKHSNFVFPTIFRFFVFYILVIEVNELYSKRMYLIEPHLLSQKQTQKTHSKIVSFFVLLFRIFILRFHSVPTICLLIDITIYFKRSLYNYQVHKQNGKIEVKKNKKKKFMIMVVSRQSFRIRN